MSSCANSNEGGSTVSYYDSAKNVEEYIQMADGYDGRDLIAVLQQHLPAHSSVLELGMGPGKDLNLLQQVPGKDYTVTGSDQSQVFLDLYRQTHPMADLMHLNACTLETNTRTFDCIYSNKVLHHLSRPKEIQQSFARQYQILNKGGLLMHSFWYRGQDKPPEEAFGGLRFVYYTPDELIGLAQEAVAGASSDDTKQSIRFEVVAQNMYKEMEDNDSFYVLLRKT